ncbi:NAD(P)H-hydrate dehydratase [Candidatus Peregrinibacteria bacterium]|nr:NAD(P)H-hydrate dehydratase [Candidatus Peregrinibacteria bacterium]
MLKYITQKEVKKGFSRRKNDSHKGQNGRVLILGGSREFFGAPILAAYGALYSGCDLVYLAVPACNFDVSRSYGADFIVRSYDGDFFHKGAIPQILPLLECCDVVIMGPGMGKCDETRQATLACINQTKKPLVLDADALFPEIFNAIHERSESYPIVLTPHSGEIDRLRGQKISSATDGHSTQNAFHLAKKDFPSTQSSKKETQNLDERAQILKSLACLHAVTILLKGHHDIIASSLGKIVFNSTGNPGMTVGGTGDVLSGVVGSFIAQGIRPFEACQYATFLVGTAGDQLFRKKSYAFSATDLALELPYILRNL